MSRLSLLVAGAAGLVSLSWLIHQGVQRPKFSYVPVTDSQILRLARTLRPNYPYSVIPGGAYSPAELRAAVARDPLVRAHYAGFDLQKVRLVRLTEPRTQYVSFRKDGNIYWTRHPLRVAAGEILLTDGRNFAKTRCGNRLSPVSMQPASHEVTASVLSPPPLDLASLPGLQFVNAPITGPAVAAAPAAIFDLASLAPAPLSASPASLPLSSAPLADSGISEMGGGAGGGAGAGGYGSPGSFESPGGPGLAGSPTGSHNAAGNGGNGTPGNGGGNSGPLPAPGAKPVSVVPEPGNRALLLLGALLALARARKLPFVLGSCRNHNR